MLLVTLAISGGNPTAISAGKVTSEPPPAAALMAPATKPAKVSNTSAPPLGSIMNGCCSSGCARDRSDSSGGWSLAHGHLRCALEAFSHHSCLIKTLTWKHSFLEVGSLIIFPI